MSTKPMTPDEIRAALKTAKITPAGIARELDKSPTAIHLVIDGNSKSHAIRTHIACCIGKPVDEVFNVKPNPTKKGRPVTNGMRAA